MDTPFYIIKSIIQTRGERIKYFNKINLINVIETFIKFKVSILCSKSKDLFDIRQTLPRIKTNKHSTTVPFRCILTSQKVNRTLTYQK